MEVRVTAERSSYFPVVGPPSQWGNLFHTVSYPFGSVSHPFKLHTREQDGGYKRYRFALIPNGAHTASPYPVEKRRSVHGYSVS